MARFENLIVWERAQEFAVEVERVAARMRYESAVQLRRSAASVADNIAEGAERGTEADFAKFLSIAAGSCAEAQCQLRRAQRCGCEARALISEALQIGWMITALRRSITAVPAPE